MAPGSREQVRLQCPLEGTLQQVRWLCLCLFLAYH